MGEHKQFLEYAAFVLKQIIGLREANEPQLAVMKAYEVKGAYNFLFHHYEITEEQKHVMTRALERCQLASHGATLK